MRLLITGASGLLGLNLALDASRAGEVIGVDRNALFATPFRLVQADLLAEGAVERILAVCSPDAVIHCAAIADLEACETNPGLAHQMNAALPKRIAELCAERQIRLIHISTDAVFGGHKDGPYTEWDSPDPRGVYAITKLEGEQAVLLAYPAATVARVNFYGWSASGRRSLAEFFVNRLSQGSNVNGFTDVRFCPLFVGHLDALLLQMLPRRMPGVYHVVGAQAITKYQFGVEIARKFGLREGLIAPQLVDTSSLKVRRSHNLWLSTNKLSTELGSELPEFSTGLSAFFAQYQQGYPQKIRSYQQPATTNAGSA
jgi:dTDP-4-dehydrorhamnose reductase